MINNNLKRIVALGSVLGIAAPASVFATNGMFLIGQSTKARGMGGTSIAQVHDTIASASNPAIMAHTGNRFDIGGDLFSVKSQASLGLDGVGSGRITVESKPDHMAITPGLYMMPNLGASWNDGDISYGFTMVSVGGGGSRYEPNIYNSILGQDTRPKLGVSLIIASLNPTIAYKINEKHSVGASLVIGMQVFKAYGLEYFSNFTAGGSTEFLTDNGTDFSYGAGIRLGWLGNFMDGDLNLGAEYTSKTYMTKFDSYKELFAEQGQLDTPGNIGLGLAYKVNNDTTVAFDINYIMYEGVAAISNIGPNTGGNLFPVSPEENELGRDNGLGFGWSNQTVYKIGLEYTYNPTWTLRTGWNYGKSPIDETREILFNIVAPATTQNHLTMGASYLYNKDTELNFSYVHAFEFTQRGPTYIGNTGEISMYQNSLGATLSMKF